MAYPVPNPGLNPPGRLEAFDSSTIPVCCAYPRCRSREKIGDMSLFRIGPLHCNWCALLLFCVAPLGAPLEVLPNCSAGGDHGVCLHNAMPILRSFNTPSVAECCGNCSLESHCTVTHASLLHCYCVCHYMAPAQNHAPKFPMLRLPTKRGPDGGWGAGSDVANV